ncbi:MAG: hypothetical protein GX456_07585 [Verrucomicrobia bacterium]|nr:hypothetical protein [Verrucomicrobiota bacterium]
MSNTEAGNGGILDALRRVAGSLLHIARNRVELFAVELRIEQTRLLALLVALGLGLLLALVGLVVLSVLIALLVWETARFLGLIILTAVLFVVAFVIFWLVWRCLQTAPKPFPETIAQLQKDCACFKKED